MIFTYHKPIRFDNYKQIEKALEMGILTDSCGYLPYESKPVNSEMFPVIFWYDENNDGTSHLPEYSRNRIYRYWEFPQYYKIVDEAIPFDKIIEERA